MSTSPDKPRQITNGHELWLIMGGPTVSISSTYSTEFVFWASIAEYKKRPAFAKIKSTDPNVYRTWDDLVRATGITRWARSNGRYGAVWAPVASFEKVAGKVEWSRDIKVPVDPPEGDPRATRYGTKEAEEAARWKLVRAEKGTKLTWTEGRPCAVRGCEYVGQFERVYEQAGRGWMTGEQKPDKVGLVCKRHNSQFDRNEAKDAERAERRAALQEERARVRQAEQAAQEMAQRVVGALQSLDVARAGNIVGTDGRGRITLTTDGADALLKVVETMLEMENL